MILVTKSLLLSDLHTMANKMFGKLVKAVVDVELRKMVVDADLHADEEMFLLENGSEQGNLWGINLYPEKYGTDNFIEFDSMINMRPSWGNRTRGVDDLHIQKKIKDIVMQLVGE